MCFDGIIAGMRRHLTAMRIVTMLAAGTVAAIATGSLWSWQFAATVGWAVAALVYTASVWAATLRFDAAQTREHASREDPERGVGDALVLLLSVASLVSVGFVLVGASDAEGSTRAAIAGLAVASVALSWILLHTLFALRYASLYYAVGAGIDFNQSEEPRYTDFAYLSFTLGMTYQVSDTSITTHTVRSAALGHALLSFLFGSVILATTVNLIAGLS
jgi:uncharacterized membrane protein